MKKSCFALFVLLLCLVCSLALADSKYIGTWMHYQVTGMNSRQYIVYEFNENGKAYYSNETFAYDGSSSVDTAVYSWIDSGDIVRIYNGSDLVKELYFVDSTRLSSSVYKNSSFYFRVMNFYDNEQTIESAEKEIEPNLEPYGKWSFYDGTTDLNKVILANDTGVLSFELYFYVDGSVYLTEGYMKKGYKGLYFQDLSGIWIGDHNDMTFLISNSSYKAWISEDGIMHVRFPSGSVYTFVRVDRCEVTK